MIERRTLSFKHERKNRTVEAVRDGNRLYFWVGRKNGLSPLLALSAFLMAVRAEFKVDPATLSYVEIRQEPREEPTSELWNISFNGDQPHLGGLTKESLPDHIAAAYSQRPVPA